MKVQCILDPWNWATMTSSCRSVTAVHTAPFCYSMLSAKGNAEAFHLKGHGSASDHSSGKNIRNNLVNYLCISEDFLSLETGCCVSSSISQEKDQVMRPFTKWCSFSTSKRKPLTDPADMFRHTSSSSPHVGTCRLLFGTRYSSSFFFKSPYHTIKEVARSSWSE